MPTTKSKSRKKSAPKRQTRKRVVKRRRHSGYGSKVSSRKHHNESMMNVQYSGGYQPGRSLRELFSSTSGKRRRSKNAFGALDVPNTMRSVSSYRRSGTYNRPFLEMPFGPPQRWLEQTPGGEQGPASSMAPPSKFGSSRSLKGKYVNPSGYLSTWYGQPRTPPASWNPLLLQGQNTFRQGINSPRLSNVVIPRRNSFGKGRFRY